MYVVRKLRAYRNVLPSLVTSRLTQTRLVSVDLLKANIRLNIKVLQNCAKADKSLVTFSNLFQNFSGLRRENAVISMQATNTNCIFMDHFNMITSSCLLVWCMSVMYSYEHTPFNAPSHLLTPSPEKPESHAQVNDPLVLLQVALPAKQFDAPVVHSLISIEWEKNLLKNCFVFKIA